MKRLFTVLTTVLLTTSVFAQTPEKMSYQAVIRNSSDQLVTNQQVGIQISILQGSASGMVVYTEAQTPTTNANGLVSIEIGGGAGFSSIDWSNDIYFIKTETDPTGGTSYTITGTSQLLSVPYALHAKTVASYPETDPVFVAWNKSTGININASQVSDFQTTVTNNAAVLANTAKNSYPPADQTKLAAITGTNTGDNAVNTLYSGLVTNATHTGDATGATALTVVGINGTSLADLETGILKNTTSTGVPSIAIAGTDYLTPTGSAASLTNFPILNQNTTGNAATVTTNANLTGDVTSTGNTTIIANKQTMTATAPVSITGSPTVIASGAVAISIAEATPSASGSMSATDKTKLDGIATPAHTIGESYGGGIIFYLDASGQHGLIATTTNQSTAIIWYNGSFTNTTAFASSVGGGDGNTSMIVFNQGTGTYAAILCYDLNTGGFTDWYLPSKYELNLMYMNIGQGNLLGLGNVGGFASYGYWSSTEYPNNGTAWIQDFANGNQLNFSKHLTGWVRAVRAF